MGFSQKADSLYKAYAKAHDLNKKTALLIEYANELRRNHIDSAIACGQLALDNARQLKNDTLIADANLVMGFCEEMKGNYKTALQFMLHAAELYKTTRNKSKLSTCYTGMGVVYWYQGFYDKAINYYKKNISISLELNDQNGLAASYGNIAIIFDEKKDLDNSLLYYNKALDIFIKEKNQRQIASCYDNMSLIFKQKSDYKTALDYNIKSYKLRESLQDTIGMLASMENLGGIFIKLNKLDDAIAISQRVLGIAERMGAKEDMKFAYINLKEAYEAGKDYRMANVILNKLMDVKDSLKNSDNLNQIAELEAKYKTKEKETELSEIKLIQQLKEKENSEKLKRKNYSIIILSLTGLFVLVMAFLLFKRFKDKKQIAEEFKLKNQEIEKQKMIIDKAYYELSEKNKDITDSIKYAKRIQEAIFPSPALFKKLFPQSFAFFRPKDIVSGDFYWVETAADGAVYIAVVDCTGHGVPGAFMSIVGVNLLSNAIHEHKCNTPAEILNQVNKDLNETLKQKEVESAVKDGMEISLCKWNKQTNEFWFAGANTVIYHISSQQVNIVKGNKHPIGNFYGEALKPFMDVKMNVNINDTVYLFSDGYADQFGGEKGKKFKYKQLEELLRANSDKPMHLQHAELSLAFENWKGNLEQVDDVCVIGVRI